MKKNTNTIRIHKFSGLIIKEKELAIDGLLSLIRMLKPKVRYLIVSKSFP